MSDEAVLCKETSNNAETIEVGAVFVDENEDEPQKFVQVMLNDLVKDSVL